MKMLKAEQTAPRDKDEAESALNAMAGSLLAHVPPAAAHGIGATQPGQLGLTEKGFRMAEARYRTLVELLPAITFMAVFDEGLSEVYVSPQIESLLGYTQREWL